MKHYSGTKLATLSLLPYLFPTSVDDDVTNFTSKPKRDQHNGSVDLCCQRQCCTCQHRDFNSLLHGHLHNQAHISCRCNKTSTWRGNVRSTTLHGYMIGDVDAAACGITNSTPWTTSMMT